MRKIVTLKNKLFIAILCTASILTCGCSENIKKQKEQQDAVIQEYNQLTINAYTEQNRIQEISDALADELIGLYLFNETAGLPESLFDTYSTFDNTTSSDEELGEKEIQEDTFIEMLQNGITTDAYDLYLHNYAEKKGIGVSEIPDKVKEWCNMSEEDRRYKEGTKEDYSDFAIQNLDVLLHNYYTRIGLDTITEVYVFRGSLSRRLSVFVVWHDGKIVNVSRFLN